MRVLQFILFIALLHTTSMAQHIPISAWEGFPEAKAFADANLCQDCPLIEISFIRGFTYDFDSTVCNMEDGRTTGWVYVFYDTATDTARSVLTQKMADGSFRSVEYGYNPFLSHLPSIVELSSSLMDSPDLLDLLKEDHLTTFNEEHDNTVIEHLGLFENDWRAIVQAPDAEMQCVVDARMKVLYFCDITVAVLDENRAMDFDLFSVYPNPFNPVHQNQLTLQYSVRSPGMVTVTLFDIGGRLISSQSQYVTEQGISQLSVPVNISLPSGAYLLTLLKANSYRSKWISVVH